MEVNYKEVIWRLTVRRLSVPFFGKSISLFYEVSISTCENSLLTFHNFFPRKTFFLKST